MGARERHPARIKKSSFELKLYQNKDSIYQTRYIRILGWCSCALGGCMFISGIAIHATPQYPDLYQNPGKDLIMVRFGRFQNRY